MPEDDAGNGGAPNPSPPSPTPPTPWFSDSHKEYVTTKGFKTGDDALVSLQNAEKLIGAERAGRTLIRPKDDNDVEGIRAWRAGIGVPEKVEGYEIPLLEGQKELDPFAKAVAGEMHKLGLTKAQAQGIAAFVNKYDADNLKTTSDAAKAKADAALAELKTEWGTAHDANHGLAVTLMGQMGFTQEEIKAMSTSADLLRRFHKGAAALGTKSMAAGQNGGTTQAQAREKLNDLRAQRADGKISEQQWMEALNTYGPIADPAAQAA